MQAIYSQIYAQFASNPFIDLESLTRKTLHAYFRGETEEVMKKQEDMQINPMQQNGQPPQTQMGQMGQNKALSTALGSGMV